MIEAALIAIVLAAPPEAPPVEQAAGPWKRHTIDNSSRGADGVRLGDANGDGLMDIATGWEEGGVVRVYLNPGPDKAKAKWPAVTVGKAKNVEDAVFVDIDGDGALDVVSSCEGKTRTMFVHWAPKDKAKYLDADSWTTEPIPATVGKQMWMYCLPMQINDKRGVDLVVGSKGKGAAVGWLESPDDPRKLTEWKYHKIVDAGWIMSIRSAKIDADDRADILVSDRKGKSAGVYWLARKNDAWKRSDISRVSHEFLFLDASRHADGRVDVIIASTRNGKIVRYARAGLYNDSGEATNNIEWTKTSIANPFGVGNGKAVAIADIDADGTLDLVHTANNGGNRKHPGVTWIPGGVSVARPRDAQNISGPQGVKFDRIELVDLDGDGDLDVITCEERDNLGVIWYENPTK